MSSHPYRQSQDHLTEVSTDASPSGSAGSTSAYRACARLAAIGCHVPAAGTPVETTRRGHSVLKIISPGFRPTPRLAARLAQPALWMRSRRAHMRMSRTWLHVPALVEPAERAEARGTIRVGRNHPDHGHSPKIISPRFRPTPRLAARLAQPALWMRRPLRDMRMSHRRSAPRIPTHTRVPDCRPTTDRRAA